MQTALFLLGLGGGFLLAEWLTASLSLGFWLSAAGIVVLLVSVLRWPRPLTQPCDWPALLVVPGLTLLLSACSAPAQFSGEPTPAPAQASGTEVCALVRSIAADSPEGQRIQEVIIAGAPAGMSQDNLRYGPFTFVEVWSIDQVDGWVMLQGRLSGPNEPAVFLVRHDGDDYRYLGTGWSGIAETRGAIGQEILRSAATSSGEHPPDALAACPDLSRWLATSGG